MESVLFLDFETKDHGVANEIGSGCFFENMLELIGYAYAIDDGKILWSTDLDKLSLLLKSSTYIVAHNIPYDYGIVKHLGKEEAHHILIDTMILSKLHHSSSQKHDLDHLGQSLLGVKKENEELADVVRELKLVKSKVQKIEKAAKQNMDILFKHRPDTVISYAKKDVEILRGLFRYFQTHSPNSFKDEVINFYSDLLKVTLKIVVKGVLIGTTNLASMGNVLRPRIAQLGEKINKWTNGVSLRSPNKLAPIIEAMGVTVPTTAKGNPSITKEWLAEQPGEFFALCREFNSLTKLENDFVTKIEEMVKRAYKIEKLIDGQEYRLHPGLTILGARTGRFTSQSFNMQQLPKVRDKSLTEEEKNSIAVVRRLAVAEPGKKWYCLDFSSQEPRIQVHYAALLKFKSGLLLAEKWNADPKFDMHGQVAAMCEISRNDAKKVNLGLAYGMGVPKLAAQNGWTLAHAKNLVKQYHKNAPYLKELINACKCQLKRNGKIKLLSGRYATLPPVWEDPETGKVQDFIYKGVNMLVQGSAADQTMMAMVSAYREGIDVGYSIHDEITICTDNEIEVLKLKHIMENCVQLMVPSLTEVTVGDNFADQLPYTPSPDVLNSEEFVQFKQNYKPMLTFVT